MEIEFIMQILSNQSMFNFACFMFICCASSGYARKQKLYNTTDSVYNKKYIIFKGSCLCNL